jgi:hypothetical protein
MIPLERFNLGRFSRNLTLTVATVLVITAFLFAPRLWTIREYLAGRMDGGRAESYLLQCADPFRRDIEPAMLCASSPLSSATRSRSAASPRSPSRCWAG